MLDLEPPGPGVRLWGLHSDKHNVDGRYTALDTEAGTRKEELG